MNKPHLKRSLKILLFISTVVSLFFIPWPLIKASLTPLPDTVQEQVDQSANYGFDGIVVYIEKKNSPPTFYTSGYKNRANKIPADPHALFKIASVSKLYTALAITKLAYQEQLALDETLGHYFPELSGRIENLDKITVSMLVQHRSGIPDYTRINNYWAHPKETDQERLELVLDKPAHFKPNEQFEYSNTNYLLLSKIIEQVTGEKKFQFIRTEILEPLHLKNTYGSILDVNLEDVMSGYYVGYENDLKTDNNGVMLSTAEDLGTFIRALNDGTVFKNKEEQALYASLYKFEHTGMMPGYQTIAKYHKSSDAVVIQFTNTTNFDGYNWSLSEIMYNRIMKIVGKKSEL